MSYRLIKSTTMLALCLVLGFPVSAWAGLPTVEGPAGEADATTSGNVAEVTAWQEQQRAGEGFVPAEGWESEYHAVMDDGVSEIDLCRTFNGGHYGTFGPPVTVCFAPEMEAARELTPVQADPYVASARAVAQLSVPAPTITISPKPSDNKWNVQAVGMPLWVWSQDPGRVTSAVSEQGIDIEMSASRGSVHFDWGDGTSSVCHMMRPRPPPNMDPLTPSPDCGHRYLKAGDYTITATASWAVSWRALGRTGTLPLTSAAGTLEIPIRSFRTVVLG